LNRSIVVHFIYLYVNGVRNLAVHNLPEIFSKISRDISDNHDRLRSQRDSKRVLFVLIVEHEIETAARFQPFYPLL